MVFSPILEVGKHLAPRTPQPPIVVGSPRYYQVTGQKPPKQPKTTGSVETSDKADAMSMVSVDSIEKPLLDSKQPKPSRLSKLFK